MNQQLQTNEELITAAATLFRPHEVAKDVSRTWAGSVSKRIFDVLVALAGLIVLSPLLVAIALLVKLTSPGPILFRQKRVGKEQMLFTVFKFRTMHATAELCSTGSTVTRCGDHRFTNVGGFLRRFKLDEFPQLFNVILGDMSLVGPRPKLPAHERMEMVCRPGITGAATLVFAHEQALLSTVPEELFEDFTIAILNEIKANIDTEYVRTCSFSSDLRIIFSTVTGLSRRNAVKHIDELLKTYGSSPLAAAKHKSYEVEWIN